MMRAQLLPDEDGCTALRKLMLAALTYADLALTDAQAEFVSPNLTIPEIDAIHELYSKLSRDMRERR